MTAIAESYLFGIASLVVSSTFFAIIITKGCNLPGLPSAAFVGSIEKIKEQLIAIQRDPIWERYSPTDEANLFDLKAKADSLAQDLKIAILRPGDKLAKRGLTLIRSDVIIFSKSMVTVKEGKSESLTLLRWKTRFADLDSAQDNNLENIRSSRHVVMDEYLALQRLKALRLGE
jgi:hypothetical protein